MTDTSAHRDKRQALLDRLDRDPSNAATHMLCLAVSAAARGQNAWLSDFIRDGYARGLGYSEFYEAFLQLYLFAGFPAAIEALAILHKVSREIEADIPTPEPAHYDAAVYQARGEQLCKTIYSSAYEKMRAKFSVIAPDLDQWMIIEGYGKTLSRNGLPIVVRELLTISILTTLGWERQLYSHIRGALLVGSTEAECDNLLALLSVMCDPEQTQRAREIFQNVLTSQSVAR